MSESGRSMKTKQTSRNAIIIDVTSSPVSPEILSVSEHLTKYVSPQPGESIKMKVYSKKTETCQNTIKESARATETKHLKDFRSIIKIVELFAKVSGIKVDEKWKWNHASTICISLIIFALSTTIYSIYRFKHSWMKMLEVVSLWGVILPETYKFYVAVNTIRIAATFSRFVENVFILNPSGRTAERLQEYCIMCLKAFKFFIAVSAVALSIFMIYPLYSFIFENKLGSLMPLVFPYIDEDTLTGYIINNLIMTIFGIYSWSGSLAFDLLLTFFIYNYHALIAVLEVRLDELADLYANLKDSTPQHRHLKLQNILAAFQDIDRYIRGVNQLFSKVICLSVGIFYIGIILALFVSVASRWLSGYGMAMFCLIQLYMVCYLGTNVTTANKKLCEIVYNIPWYDFPKPAQRSILVLLQSTQNSLEIWMLIAPLNVETAMKITKNIYSCFAMMLNFLE